ncbi:serine/threonine-protein kinase [Streptomyces sp. WZ-12]|uniref:serine/threonine-protein kinase n=1 Tax=Streptomyces sp. WZ-12 TaxID=3030210 RepID=UPI002380CD30|nr:serine/threonine-protein kinase [Streptomyces sp. WZ-12]
MGDDMTPTQDAGRTERALAGRYRLNTLIGAGGMGEVWQAYDVSLDRRVAVKMMLDEQPHAYAIRNAAHQEAMETRRLRFLREVRTTAGLHEHPGIPAVYDTGFDEASGRLYVVMQLLRGRELQTLVDETDYDYEPLPLAWAAAIGAQIASALDEVHRHDVVHRDIKPANLMLTPGGVVKVLDFGVAALLGSGSNPHLTQPGMTVGTPAYMSPEQSLANAVGPAADIYALACVIYQLLTGRTPFTESDGKSVTWHQVNTDAPAVGEVRSDVPDDIEQLLLGMMEKDPEDRMSAATVYQTLLPLASQGTPAGTSPLVAAGGLELDPCTPFTRPFGESVRRGRGRARAYTPTVLDAAAADPGVLSLSEAEADEAAERASELVGQKQFTQAADVLADVLARATDNALVAELTLSLAHVKFLAGAHSAALGLFQEAAKGFGRRFGSDDIEVRRCLYYEAECRMELGETSAAVAAFTAYVQVGPDESDEDAVDRHLEALAQIMRLEAGSERFPQARAAAIALRDATRRYRGLDAPELADIDGFIQRLKRFE